MTYREKLRSPLWQRKRLQILQRDDWRCCICHRADKNLQVHHLIYSKREPWEYPDEMFQSLCEDCHAVRQEHTDKAVDAIRIALSKVPTERMIAVSMRLIQEAFGEVCT